MSSILYQNPNQTVFLIDIPSSIALAQDLSPLQQSEHNNTTRNPQESESNQTRKHLLSTTPPKAPYPATKEPKTDTARQRILARTSISEREYHDAIVDVVRRALDEVTLRYRSEWCLPRRVVDDGDDDGGDSKYTTPLHVRERVPGVGKGSMKGKRKRKRKRKRGHGDDDDDRKAPVPVPIILSPTCSNRFGDIQELSGTMVKNPFCSMARVVASGISSSGDDDDDDGGSGGGSNGGDSDSYANCTFNVPPLSTFCLCNLPLRRGLQEGQEEEDGSRPRPQSRPWSRSQSTNNNNNKNDNDNHLIPGLPRTKQFNLILLDPPWPNRSVRRSGHYQTQAYTEMDGLSGYLRDVLRVHLHVHVQPTPPRQPRQPAIAAIWVTNSEKCRRAAHEVILRGAGLDVVEEWVWVKVTTGGEPVTELGGVWRKPYEVLVVGRRVSGDAATAGDKVPVKRRVIVGVPDVHSRKPNLREVFERVFFGGSEYSALEMFARNLTAGWWACGNEVLGFNSERWWA